MHIVTNWFKHRLKQLGYPTDNVSWSLGYCQGDGMAFSGYINFTVIGKRLVPELPEKVWEFMPLSLQIEQDGRYSHYNSMRIPMDASEVVEMAPEDVGGIPKRIALYRLLEVLVDDVKETSRTLEAEGYRIIEGGCFEDEVMMEKRTASFRVVVTKFRDDDYDPHDFGGEYYEEDIKSILDGKTEYFGIKVEIFDITDEDEDEGCLVAEHSLWGITADKGSRYASGMVREVVAEAIAEARSAMKMQKHTSPLQLAA